jgi:glycosyltransferase involved in cell wall biosynthesis
MLNNAAVDVLLPVYNAEKYLEESIESIIHQTYKDWNLLIIDDGSTDCSLEIIKLYAQKDSRIHFRTRQNFGLVATLNELVKWSSAPLIARMDADDISVVDRLEKQLNYLQESTDVQIVGCWAETFGSKHEVWHYRQFDEQIRITSLFGKCCLLIAALLAKREVFENYIFDTKYTHLEEYDFISRIVVEKKYNMACVRKVLYRYRQHDDSVIYKNKDHRKVFYQKRLANHLIGMGIKLNTKEFDHYLDFIRCNYVSSVNIKSIAEIVKKVYTCITLSVPDENREFAYRWLLFCKKNRPINTYYTDFFRHFGDHSFVFIECKKQYIENAV